LDAFAAVWYVDTGNTSGVQNGESWATAFSTIQPAIEAAFDAGGGEVWVAEGTYTSDLVAVVAMRPGVHLYGGFAGDETSRAERDWETRVTRIDGEDTRRCVFGADEATLDGFTVTRGYVDAGGGAGMLNLLVSSTVRNCTFIDNEAGYNGGGIVNQACIVSVTNCSFTGNEAAGGGAIYNHASSGTISNCTFTGNEAWYASTGGGAIYNFESTVTVAGCTFTESWAEQWGGAMYNEKSPITATDCTFTSNMTASGAGGGMFNEDADVTIADCAFVANHAPLGRSGGMHNEESNATITNCTFTNNRAGTDGGGMCNERSSPSITNSLFMGNEARGGYGGGMGNEDSPTAIANCLFIGNQATTDGGGMASDGSAPVVTNCTFAENDPGSGTGAGMFNHASSPTVTNCIFWNDSPQEINNAVSSNPVVTYSDVRGGYSGVGNIDADPSFQNIARHKLRLRSTSPCIDKGTAVAWPSTDVADVPRPQGTAYDMGAYEFRDDDDDGMDDTWETENGLDPADSSDAAQNPDHDALSNVEEYELGTDPNDYADPAPADFHVSPSGNDETGDGTQDNPWQTIGFAMSMAALHATPLQPLTIRLAPGTYPEKVVFAPDVAVVGASPAETIIKYFNTGDETHRVMTAAARTRLSDCSVQLPAGVSETAELLRIEDVSMHVTHVLLNGNDAPHAIAVFVSGDGSSDSIIKNCTIKRLEYGIWATDTAANITRNAFQDIFEDAVFVRRPEKKAAGASPLLGDAGTVESSGFNRFQNVDGFLVKNMNPAVTAAEYNDWGVYEQEQIAAKVSYPEGGEVDFDPWLGKGLLPGTVVVQVLDSVTSGPVDPGDSPEVSLAPAGLAAARDPQSGLFFATLTTGTYTVYASADGYVGAYETAIVSDAEVCVVVLTLSRESGAEGEGEGEGPTPPPHGCNAGTANANPPDGGFRGNILVLACATAVLLASIREKHTETQPTVSRW